VNQIYKVVVKGFIKGIVVSMGFIRCMNSMNKSCGKKLIRV
jgi:hypothetical protein